MKALSRSAEPKSAEVVSRSSGTEPLIAFGREISGDLPAATRREWLVSNGLGGYASGTVAGVATRRYHGLLVAALHPPTSRTVLVSGAVEWATIGGMRFPLSTHAYADGTINPQGYRHIQEFRLEGSVPVWTFALGSALLERRIWMEHEANTTYVHYTLMRGEDPIEIELMPLVSYRDFHSLGSGNGWRPGVETIPQGVEIRAFDGAIPFRVLANHAEVEVAGDWWWGFHHAAETERGLDDRSDQYAVGRVRVSLARGESLGVVFSTEAAPDLDTAAALAREQSRERRLLDVATATSSPLAVQQLVLAADQFVVRREVSDQGAASRSIVAGYHWFNDWGRDTMIALPGLTLSTGRAEVAAEILHGFARYVADGLLPNNFPDRPGVDAGYNTADAALWYIWAVERYLDATGDRALVTELLPVIRKIIDCYSAGTRYGIGVDPADGLLRAGEPGLQLTWMDAKVGDWVVTPRIGKPAELNALWHNALRVLAAILGDAGGAAYRSAADRAAASFGARFWDEERGMLADVIDGPDGDDWSVRPNQIFAVSLPYPLLNAAQAEQVVTTVGRTLLTSYGLRSLAPSDPAYRPEYGGDAWHRDGAYHQGTVWAWLLGTYAEAHYRVHQDRDAALAFLQPVSHHLSDAGLGTISEIFEAAPPHAPKGCIAQAWSVAEVLRVWKMLAQ